jgi:hypothetical protein
VVAATCWRSRLNLRSTNGSIALPLSMSMCVCVCACVCVALLGRTPSPPDTLQRAAIACVRNEWRGGTLDGRRMSSRREAWAWAQGLKQRGQCGSARPERGGVRERAEERERRGARGERAHRLDTPLSIKAARDGRTHSTPHSGGDEYTHGLSAEVKRWRPRLQRRGDLRSGRDEGEVSGACRHREAGHPGQHHRWTFQSSADRGRRLPDPGSRAVAATGRSARW